MSSEFDIAIPTTPKSNRKKPQSRFQNLWDEAERLKRRNLELEDSLNALVQRIKADLGPAELEMGRSMREQMDKLIVFAGRKSLPLWQKDVLDSWITTNMETLGSMGLIDDLLRDSLAALQLKVLGIELDPDTDLSATEQLMRAMDESTRAFDEQFEHDAVDSTEPEIDFDDWFQEQLLRADSESEDEQVDRDTDTEENFENGSTRRAGQHPQELFKTLFHRVARVLHPDKETDPAEREKKQELMAQLLDARRQHDLIKVFNLYRDHVDASLDFADQELKELEDVLLRFIEQESQRLEEIAEQSELHFIAFSQFYSKDPKRVDKRLKQKIKEIERRHKEIKTFSTSVTSLQKLKPYLEARYDAMLNYF